MFKEICTHRIINERSTKLLKRSDYWRNWKIREVKREYFFKEIQMKQNVHHGLTNVTDACFEIFIEMDKKIRDIEPLNNLTIYTSTI